MAPTNVVVIGAASAGVGVAHSLLQGTADVKVVLINPSPKFYWNIAAPRILAKPTAFKADQYLIPIKDNFAQYSTEKFEFIAGNATGIDVAAKTVSVAVNGSGNPQSLSYDYLVIASGSTTASTTGDITGISIPFKPSNRDDMQEVVEAAQQKIASAKQIVIGGAGPVGVELAGELAEAMQESGSKATITLVSATDRVLSTLKPSGSAAGEKQLRQKGIEIIASTKIIGAEADGANAWTVSLDNGTQLSADLYIPTTGAIPNNSFIPADFLDQDGWVKVDKELRVEAEQPLPIYAAGDINNNSMRLSFKANEQAKVVAANITADILGSGERTSYDQGQSVMMVVPVGSSGGTGQLFGMTPFSFLVKMVKGRDYFISKAAGVLAGKA
ncbi:FAD-dependent pyridine nucleotide-disulfide oxidoreductase [Penicillium macrosclerotiorum]|uniref:FAD-dependent pyridine nucleotide-disulfide oxidoreductase n=1 Tax=Penicillium macrosclerotiorum TaxID=303699 RepID=UPI0025493E3C|nr:FAD-dependent pyridine nucleotide-disulfide oxidoreductase [Penicillium macrosclerotiorum]KAJ5682772.1 FAD-dependent pyridine nucleotide-disulfide oxidoreductase [Penicillium macrosclerotiorum]